MYCSNCGAQIDVNAMICPKCGVPTAKFKPYYSPDNKPAEGFDWLTTLLLCFFLGTFGIHNFYTRKNTVAIIQLLTLGGCGIWVLVDFIMIILDTYVDGYGRPLIRK